MVDDARFRVLTLINTYLTAANVTKDDGVIQASAATAFSDPQYPLNKVFWGNKSL